MSCTLQGPHPLGAQVQAPASAGKALQRLVGDSYTLNHHLPGPERGAVCVPSVSLEVCVKRVWWSRQRVVLPTMTDLENKQRAFPLISSWRRK